MTRPPKQPAYKIGGGWRVRFELDGSGALLGPTGERLPLTIEAVNELEKRMSDETANGLMFGISNGEETVTEWPLGAPGSNLARFHGCICSQTDNHYGFGRNNDHSRFGFFISSHCHVHFSPPNKRTDLVKNPNLDEILENLYRDTITNLYETVRANEGESADIMIYAERVITSIVVLSSKPENDDIVIEMLMQFVKTRVAKLRLIQNEGTKDGN